MAAWNRIKPKRRLCVWCTEATEWCCFCTKTDGRQRCRPETNLGYRTNRTEVLGIGGPPCVRTRIVLAIGKGRLGITMPIRHNSNSEMELHTVRRSPDPRIESSFAFIAANLNQRIRLADLAQQSGLSAARYSHLFALSTG